MPRKKHSKHQIPSKSNPSSVDLRKRGLLFGLGAAAGSVAALTLQSLFATTIDIVFRPSLEAGRDAVTRFFPTFRPNEPLLAGMDRFDAQHIDLIKSIIGISPKKTIKMSGGHDHYLYPGVIHPDNELALNVMTRVFWDLSQSFETCDGTDHAAQGTFVCFGGPISNLRSAAFLGYQHIDPTRPQLGLRRRDDTGLYLPISFEVESEKLRKAGLVVKGSLHNDVTPEWAIRIGTGDNFLTTEVGKQDYLLVSRLPNWLATKSREQAEPEDVVTLFSGCHGAGMGAVRPLFENGELLGRLDDLSKESPYWQALIGIESCYQRLFIIMVMVLII